MNKIYFNNTAIAFTNLIEEAAANVRNIELANEVELNRVVETLHNEGYSYDINLSGYDTNNMFNNFCQLYNFIEAAGGVVQNTCKEFLLIKRFGIWDLPKGKLEIGESVIETAVREVCEETGLTYVEIVKPLSDTFHIYQQKRKWYLKKTHWFLMKTEDTCELIPQTKEDISKAIWMSKPDAYLAISKSYRSLYDTFGYLFC